MERLHQLIFHSERPLRTGPDGELAIRSPFGDSSSRLEWGMLDVSDRVSPLDFLGGRAERLIDIAGFVCAAPAFCRATACLGSLAQIVVKLRLGNLFGRGPTGPNLVRGRLRRVRRGSCYAEEFAILDDGHVRKLLGGRDVN